MDLIHWTQLASTNGDGTGTSDFIGNYSSTGVVGYIKAPAGQTWDVYRMIVRIEDEATIHAEKYGALAALSEGVDLNIRFESGGAIVGSLDGGIPVKTNAQWASLCYDTDVKSWRTGGAGDELLVARYTFNRLGGPIQITGEERIELDFDDNFTGIISHTFLFQGIVVSRA